MAFLSRDTTGCVSLCWGLSLIILPSFPDGFGSFLDNPASTTSVFLEWMLSSVVSKVLDLQKLYRPHLIFPYSLTLDDYWFSSSILQVNSHFKLCPSLWARISASSTRQDSIFQKHSSWSLHWCPLKTSLSPLPHHLHLLNHIFGASHTVLWNKSSSEHFLRVQQQCCCCDNRHMHGHNSRMWLRGGITWTCRSSL